MRRRWNDFAPSADALPVASVKSVFGASCSAATEEDKLRRQIGLSLSSRFLQDLPLPQKCEAASRIQRWGRCIAADAPLTARSSSIGSVCARLAGLPRDQSDPSSSSSSVVVIFTCHLCAIQRARQLGSE